MVRHRVPLYDRRALAALVHLDADVTSAFLVDQPEDREI
jgi:hypothetical protein